MSSNDKRIVIIGAGPTGLGAAHRLSELKYTNWDIYERNPHVGGLSASLKDEKSFTWDIGLHVIFSNIPYFHRIVDAVLGKDYFSHMRKSFIYSSGIWIPYPFQNNIRYLEPHRMSECLTGLLRAGDRRKKRPRNFLEWIHGTFGSGIAKYFMVPYNLKVWRHSLRKMSYGWIGERVSVINVERILENIINDADDISWGIHNRFKYPKRGGSGEIFRRMCRSFTRRPHISKELVRVDSRRKRAFFKDGTATRYDYLINSSSLDEFVLKTLDVRDSRLRAAARELKHTKAWILGIGIEGAPRSDTFWSYFPDRDIPFYRMTYSSYSPYNAPQRNSYTIMCEICEKVLNKNPRDIKDGIIRGMVRTGLIARKDLKRIVSKYLMRVDRSYPIPTVNRDRALRAIEPYLVSRDIYSRGRFGAWKYEVGNMDHSFMQGVEAVDRILFSKEEKTLT